LSILSFMRRLLPVFLAFALPATAFAQVGYDPARSPYRELRFGQFVGASAGWVGGSGGSLALSPHGGPVYGIRYELLGANTLSISLAGSYADLERVVIDPDAPAVSQVSGPVKQSALNFEGILQFTLTGGKTWHRLAPFVSGGLGLMLASRVPEDTTGFSLRTRAVLTPGIGTRVFLSQRLFLRLEARASFWQVTYPTSFQDPPANAPQEPPVLGGRVRKEWVSTPTFTAGLSYAFFRPF
jgi:hypothetical protein